MSDDEKRNDILTRLVRMFNAWDKLEEKSNEFLAEMLMEHVMSDTDVTSPRYALFAEIYDRLLECPN